MGCITSHGRPPAKPSQWAWEIVTTPSGQKKKQLVKKVVADDRQSK